MSSRRWFTFIALAFVFCFLAIAPAAYASDDAAPADALHGGGKSLWDLFKATGVVGILMVLLSVAGMAIAIDTAMAFSITKLAPPELVAQVSELVDNNEFEEAAEVALASDSYFGKVVGAGLVAADHGFETAVGTLDTTANEESFKLNVKMSYLSLVGNIAPLLGLLGTVTGMISAFQVIETKKSPTPADLAIGVYESLVNTTMGLFIAIVFLTIFFLFKNKVTSLCLGVSTLGHELVKHAAGDK